MRTTLLAALLAIPSMLSAENLGVLIGNANYRYIDAVSDGTAPLRADVPLREAGYTTIVARDATEDGLARALNELSARLDNADKVVVVLSGWFFVAGGETFFAPVDLRGTSLGTIATDAMPLTPLLNMLAERPGQSVLMVASTKAWGDDGRDGRLYAGVSDMDIPEGTVMIVGRPDSIDQALRERMLRPGASLVEVTNADRRIALRGSENPDFSIVDRGMRPRIVVERDQVGVDPDDIRTWQTAEDVGSRKAYEIYLQRFPQGRYAWLARQRLQEIEDSMPEMSPQERAEIALGLSSREKRDMQRYLGVLGYDPRGVDGLFGPGTRAALRAWQRDNDMAQTGYFSEGSVAMIRDQGEARIARQKERERREEQERRQQDRAYWQQTGQTDTMDGLRAYLSEYPDGLFSEQARNRLTQLKRQERRAAAAQERRDFAQARQVDTIAAYRTFLRQYPEGVHADDARQRIAFLKDRANRGREQTDWKATLAADTIDAYLAFLDAYPNSAKAVDARQRIRELEAAQGDTVEQSKQDRAARAEADLNLNQAEKLLIEASLLGIGQNPGTVDGVFDNQTRRSIASYQRGLRLDSTGYLDAKTIEALRAGRRGGN